GRLERRDRRRSGAHLPHGLRPRRAESDVLFVPRGVLSARPVVLVLVGLAGLPGAAGGLAQAADSTPPPLATARGRFWVRPLLSLAVPGAGQLAAHQDRGAGYLAVELYTPPAPSSAEYAAALQFYEQHAVGPGFRWSWRNAAAQQQVFRQTIAQSDHAFRSAQSHLGMLLANHVASAVDALISSRLSTLAGRTAALHTVIGPTTVVRLSVAF